MLVTQTELATRGLACLTRKAARQDVFEHIEMCYKPKCKHTNNGMLSPVDFETRQQTLNEAGVWETMGPSAHPTAWITL